MRQARQEPWPPWGSVTLTVNHSSHKELLVATSSSTGLTEAIRREFFYPAIRRRDNDVSSWMPPTVEDSGTRRPLVVEDDEYSRLHSHRIITNLGHEAESVALGQDAHEKCLHARYDTIILDIQLPDIDGVSIARTIRSECGPNSNTPTVAVTAHSTAQDRALYEQAG